jgi:hypothetical protein
MEVLPLLLSNQFNADSTWMIPSSVCGMDANGFESVLQYMPSPKRTLQNLIKAVIVKGDSHCRDHANGDTRRACTISRAASSPRAK